MAIDKVNRKYKDGIFRGLFNNEEELLDLYNAISGSNYPKGTPIQIVTLDNVIFNGIKNDIAFIIDYKFIILTEHQSTLSPNFALRQFCYLAREYEKLYFSEMIYSKQQVKVPTPELYVFYDGVEDAPVEWTQKLSDAFIGKCDTISVEAVVKVFNVNYEKGAELLKKCKTLREYSLFIQIVRAKYKEIGDVQTAVRDSIRECIENGIMAEFLKTQKGEIMSILEVDLTVEERLAIRENDGFVKGFESGKKEGLIEVARNFKKAGVDIQIIIDSTGLTKEQVEEL